MFKDGAPFIPINWVRAPKKPPRTSSRLCVFGPIEHVHYIFCPAWEHALPRHPLAEPVDFLLSPCARQWDEMIKSCGSFRLCKCFWTKWIKFNKSFLGVCDAQINVFTMSQPLLFQWLCVGKNAFWSSVLHVMILEVAIMSATATSKSPHSAAQFLGTWHINRTLKKSSDDLCMNADCFEHT